MPPDPPPPPAIVRHVDANRTNPAAGGDIVDSVTFVLEYRRRHPGEKAVLLLPPLRHPRQVVLPAAAFTRNGRLFIHSSILGDVLLEGRQPAEVDRKAEVYGVYAGLLRAKSGPSQRNSAGVRIDPLPGDRSGQLTRALSRLQALGVMSSIVAPVNSRPAFLILEYGGMQFGWAPELGISFYNGLGDPPVRNSVIEGIVFSVEYRKAHPTERVAVYIDPLPDASTPGRMVATTVYTSEGRVYSHHLLTGDIESTLRPPDLDDREKVIEVTRRIYQARRAAQRATRRTIPRRMDEPGENLESQPEIVAAELKACGVPSRLVPAGEPDDAAAKQNAVRFEWQGESYTYSAELGCFRGGLPR